MRSIIIKTIGFLTIVGVISCSSNKDAVNRKSAYTQNKNKSGRQNGPPSVDEIFKMDTNNDDKLSKSEVKGPLLDRFADIDSDSDGYISKTEFENAYKPQRGAGRRPNN